MTSNEMRIAQLHDECQKYQALVMKYADQVKERVAAQKVAQRNVEHQEKENIKMLTKVEETKQNELRKMKEKCEAEKQNLADLTTKLYAFKEQCQALPSELTNKRQQSLAKQAAIDKMNQLYDEAIKEKEYKTNELSLGRDFYRKYLSLDFQRVQDDRLRFVFTNIDPAQHERPFSFCVFINSDNQYNIVECEPTIADVQSLVNQLNTDNNFARFVQQMRRKFRELALRE